MRRFLLLTVAPFATGVCAVYGLLAVIVKAIEGAWDDN